jgi:hypothetical protein
VRGRPATRHRDASSEARRAASILARQEERGHRRADAGARATKKRTWGTLNGAWVPHNTRDQVVDYVKHWADRTELPARQVLSWLGLGTSKFHDWKHRYGKVNEHNGMVPRDWWLEDWEKRAIVDFHDRHPLEGYRRLTFMMLDDDVVAVSPASVYRVLKQANRLDRRRFSPSKKGTGFVQSLVPHEHWLVDISYNQRLGDVLLSDKRAGRLQPIHCALGDSREHDRARCRDNHAAGVGAASRPRCRSPFNYANRTKFHFMVNQNSAQ